MNAKVKEKRRKMNTKVKEKRRKERKRRTKVKE